MKYKAAVFDFDGTIADTVEAGARIFNDIAEQKGFEKITWDNQMALRTMPPRKAIRKLGVKFYQIPKVALEIRKGLRGRLLNLKIYPGVSETLSELKNKGLKIFLASSNSRENVEAFIKQNDLDFFDGLFCEKRLFGKAKALRRLLEQNNLKPEEVVLVADEIRDIKAARKENIAVAAVTWGLNSKQGLLANHPDFIVDNPEQLLQIA